MIKTSRRLLAVAGAVVLVLLMTAGPAAADVVDPSGACVGSGTWQEGGFSETSTDHVPDDVIEIPRKDEVSWSGAIGGAQLGDEVPRRDIAGKVELQLPPPVGWITVDDWGGSSVRAANEGVHDYDLPSVVSGVKMKLRGQHSDAGTLTCSGSVFVKVEGSNPLLIGGIVGMVLTGIALLFAGRPTFTQVGQTFEDVNPG
jgi:opacity protein-like surface antigen